MGDTEDDYSGDWDSGPYCQHWGDPGDCDEVCARCGHECHAHSGGECRECPAPAYGPSPCERFVNAGQCPTCYGARTIPNYHPAATDARYDDVWAMVPCPDCAGKE